MTKSTIFTSIFAAAALFTSFNLQAQCTATPALEATTEYSTLNSAFNIPCGTTTGDLSTLTASNTPDGSVITWHSATPAEDANLLASFTSVSGTDSVYASFYNAASDCYSPTKAIVVYAAICAETDDYTDSLVIEGELTVLPSIFANDKYNNDSLEMPNPNVEFIYEYWDLSYATLNPDGTVNVLATTPAGTYYFYYSIIDIDPDAEENSNSSFGEVIVVVTTPLPITLASFDVINQANNVQLNWVTASEQNNKGFFIERKAQNSDWKTIGFVQSNTDNGNSNESLSYKYSDAAPQAGLNMYRLRQQDIDGKESLSEVKSAIVDQRVELSVYPNPAKDAVLISGLSANSTLKIYNYAGQQVKTIYVAEAGQHNVSLGELAAGAYQMSIVDSNGNVQVRKIVKVD